MTHSPRTWLTDDRDMDRRNYLEVLQAENGDWYIAIAPEGEKTMGRAVRISTSGGAAKHRQGLPLAVKRLWEAMAEVPEPRPTKCNRHVDCEAADAAIRERHGAFAHTHHCYDECCEECFGS